MRWAISLSRFLSFTEKRSKYKKTYNELSSLTDRELNDIGIRRSDIRSVALRDSYGAEVNHNLKGWI